MAEMHERESGSGVDGDENLLRQRLLRRIGLAGVVIVALVASLAMFDAVFVNTPTHEASDPAAVPVSTAPAPLEEAAKPEDKPAEAAVETASEAAPAEDKPAVDKAEVKPEAPPPAVAKGKVETKPITRPASRSDAKPSPVVPEGSATPTLPPLPPPPVTKPAPATSTAPLAAQPTSTSSRPLTAGQGYLVQMGVFSNIANAEDLKGRLDKAGIPAHIEARVQVGPFKNRAEAEAAQKKLAEMGLSGLLLSPRK